MPRRDRQALVGLTVLASLCMLAEAGGLVAPDVVGHALLYAAPLLLLALPLLAGRYLGEDRLARAAERIRARRRRPARRIDPAGAALRPLAELPRGGRLIASSLANRPPPAAVPAS